MHQQGLRRDKVKLLQKERTFNCFEYTIVLFWALWTLVIFLADFFNLLQVLNWLTPNWKFTSDNYALITKSTAIYGLGNGKIAITFFVIIVLWAALISWFFWKALLVFKRNDYFSWLNIAFINLFVMNALFLVLDEIFIQYALGHGHMNRLTFILITYIGILMMHFNNSNDKKRNPGSGTIH